MHNDTKDKGSDILIQFFFNSFGLNTSSAFLKAVSVLIFFLFNLNEIVVGDIRCQSHQLPFDIYNHTSDICKSYQLTFLIQNGCEGVHSCRVFLRETGAVSIFFACILSERNKHYSVSKRKHKVIHFFLSPNHYAGRAVYAAGKA